MLKLVLGGLLGDPLGRKEGRKGARIVSMSRRKNSLALEKGHFKPTGQCQALSSVSILTEGTRNSNVSIGWYRIQSWKLEIGVGEGTARSVQRGRLVWEVTTEKGPIIPVPTETGSM